MKSTILLAALLIIACDDESTDPMTGRWTFSTQNISGTFRITGSKPNYIAEAIIVNISGTESTWGSYEFREVDKGSIETIILRKSLVDTEGIGFYNCKLVGNSFTVDSVIYRKGTSQTKFLNQVIVKN